MITKWAGFVVFVVLSISCLVSTVGLLSWLLFKVPETASGTGLGIVALVTWVIIGYVRHVKDERRQESVSRV